MANINFDALIRESSFFSAKGPKRIVPKGRPPRKGLQQIVGRLIMDKSFQGVFRQDPEQAAAMVGVALTPYELAIAVSLGQDFTDLSSLMKRMDEY